MGIPKNYIIDLQGHARPPKLTLPESVIGDIDWFNKNRSSSRSVDAISGIRGITIHATAGSTSGGALSWWKNPQGAKASAHWIVPGEVESLHGKKILACVYEARTSWHCRPDKSHPAINNGKANINNWTLGIEIVNTQDIHNYTDQYSNWQVDVTAMIVRYAWAKYPNLRWIFSHAAVDPARRADPGKQFPWDAFEGKILNGVGGEKPIEIATPQATAADLTKAAKPCCG